MALLIEGMNASKVEVENLIKTLFNHAKNVNSYPDSATPKFFILQSSFVRVLYLGYFRELLIDLSSDGIISNHLNIQ